MPAAVGVNSSNESPDTRFAGLESSLTYFFSTIVLVWIESFLEELLDRGYLLTRLERVFSIVPFGIILAVVIQAAISDSGILLLTEYQEPWSPALLAWYLASHMWLLGATCGR